jgi:hypothetical protein
MNTVWPDLFNRADLVGRRVVIQAAKQQGSARLLNGLTGTVIAPHPLTPNWVKMQLDPNPVTPHQEWTIPVDRLVLLDGD